MVDSVLANGRVLDVRSGRLLDGLTVVVSGGRIVAVGEDVAAPPSAQVLDLSGRTLMPGLIDCHVHVTQATADLAEIPTWPASYAAVRTAQVLRGMLHRGFTTVRDVGGADVGMARAVAEGLVEGPRLLVGGPILAPTGGHFLTGTCDGATEVRKAVRAQMAGGAHHVKLTVGGSVVSPLAIDGLLFSEDEIRAAVEEAAFADRYVAAHSYTAEGVERALRCGVRTIEHGNLIDAETVALLQEADAYLVPTLAGFDALARSGARHLPAQRRHKLEGMLDSAYESLERADRAGVMIGYGTDLQGDMHARQLEEFRLRAQVQKPADIIRSATVVGAEIVGMAGRIGEIVVGAHADLLVVDGNPLEEITVLTNPDRRLRLVMREGRIVKEVHDVRR